MSQHSVIALSISQGPDLVHLGFGRPHLEEAMVEIARYLLIAGASLAYGGNLNPGGFTCLLFELVRSYRQSRPESPPISNYLAWPVHSVLPDEELEALEREFDGAGRLIFLDLEGRTLTAEERRKHIKEHPSKAEMPGRRALGLTAMRRRMASDCSARVLLGGKVSGYRGAMPGIAEEALLTLKIHKPLYAIGGFGGCTRDLIHVLESRQGQDPWPERRPDATGPGYSEALRAFGQHSWEDLRNGLSREENRALITASHPAVILRCLLHGLRGLGLLPNEGSWNLGS